MSPPIQSATKTRRCTRHPVPGDELREPRAQPASCSLGFAGRRNGTQLPAGRVLQLRATAPTRVRLRSHPQPAACSSGSEPVPGGWEKIGRVGNLPRVKLRIAFDSRGLRLRNALAARGRRKSVGKVSVPPGRVPRALRWSGGLVAGCPRPWFIAEITLAWLRASHRTDRPREGVRATWSPPRVAAGAAAEP